MSGMSSLVGKSRIYHAFDPATFIDGLEGLTEKATHKQRRREGILKMTGGRM